jgi:hypothetical protein
LIKEGVLKVAATTPGGVHLMDPEEVERVRLLREQRRLSRTAV